MEKKIYATFTGFADEKETREILEEEFELTEEDFDMIEAHIGEVCELTIACLVDREDFESNYYDAVFGDGFEMPYALSGVYFKEE